MVVSINQEKQNQIVNLNASCSNMFGYSKSELMNRKLNVVIPNLYGSLVTIV